MDLTTTSGRSELGTRIQSAIMGAGFDSLPEFARELGWSRALIYQYVSGRVLVQLDRLAQIAVSTGKPLEWFLAADPNGQLNQAAELLARVQQAEQRGRGLAEELAEERAARVQEERRARAAELQVRGELCRARRRAGDAAGLVEAAAAYLELARQAGEAAAVLQAQLQMGHGWFLQGDLGRSREVLLEAVQAAAESGEAGLLNSARQELVRVLLQGGQVEEGRRVAEQLARAELWWPQWSGRLSLAAIAAQQAEFDQAADQLTAAARIIESGEETPARRALARTYLLSNQVTQALMQGDYRMGAALNQQLRALAQQANVIDQLRESELNGALLDLRRGAVAEAEEKLRLLEEWSALADDRRLGVLCQVFRSELRRRCGDFEEARRLAQTALDEAVAAGQPQARVEAALALGQAYLAAGRTEEAVYQLERAEEQATGLGLSRLQCQARLVLGQAGVGDQGETLTALRALGLRDLQVDAALGVDTVSTGEEAVATAGEIDYFWGGHAALLALAARAGEQGEEERAGEYLARAKALFRASGAGQGGRSVLDAEGRR